MPDTRAPISEVPIANSQIDPRLVEVASVADIRRAAEAFRDQIAALDRYRVVVTDNIATRRPMADADGEVLAEAVFGFDRPEDRWWRRSQLALTSPLAKAVRYESEPFWANDAGIHGLHPNFQLQSIDLTDFRQRSFFAAAIVVPVHLPFGQLGMAAFGTLDPRWTDLDNNFRMHADVLMMLTRRFVTSYALVRRGRYWLPRNCSLTPREIYCLRGAARGDTDDQIARQLGRSHATVRFHMRNAWEKLDAVSRSQAVFKAGQLGFLGSLN